MADKMTDGMVYMLILSVASFLFAMFLTPIYTYFAYKHKFWKRQRTTSVTGEALKVMTKLHAKKFTRRFPTMAGIVGVLAITTVTVFCNLDRGQTWLILAALLGGSAIGLIDDLINVFGSGKGVAGLRSSVKFAMISVLGLMLGWFFYYKLGWDAVNVPFIGEVPLGIGIIPVFAFAVVATGNAVNISDGLDGLAGGLLSMAYGAFGVIALVQGNYGIAGFCFTVIGAMLAYLWFNIYPARFMMGDVGSFAYGAGLGVVAMMTDTFFLLPIIGVLFVVEAGSSLIQILSKKFFRRKIFISAPIHHHLEARGWEETKITMRFWVIGAIAGFIGVVLAFGGGMIK
ncbi:MAG: phospho-N-acetylmuramoyl-pentapeptide-transferase [Candidatus Nomurabacteria bacterium]|jgi:phospho-N-acetylmuramoyl-pentapeptide-transferase|nr:phospho-N-acetylmuramoyl-pentapeptide-transferase [Candidatus Nomurabacteria bacterium]